MTRRGRAIPRGAPRCRHVDSWQMNLRRMLEKPGLWGLSSWCAPSPCTPLALPHGVGDCRRHALRDKAVRVGAGHASSLLALLVTKGPASGRKETDGIR